LLPFAADNGQDEPVCDGVCVEPPPPIEPLEPLLPLSE
jgi:hypothetical protein